MSFGTRLKQLRVEKGMKQSELGVVLGLTNATISAYENETRTPDINTAVDIASFFGVSVDNLLGVHTGGKPDLRSMLLNGAMTYGGEDISKHDLAVLENVITAILSKGDD